MDGHFIRPAWHRLVLGAALALSLAGCDARSESDPPVVRPVREMLVAPTLEAQARFAGTVAPRVESDLAFRTMGRVIARKVTVGDLVRKDELVAQIDPLALKLAVTSAQAALRNAQAQLDNATITERRKRTLADSNAGSVADLDLAVQSLKAAQATLREAQASLDKAKEQLGYADLTADFDGVVTSTSVEVGQVVTAGQTVLRLARLDARDVLVDVPEAQLGAMRLGGVFTVALQLDPGVVARGTVREIAPQAEATTRTYRVKIALDQPPEAFRLGSVVSAAPVIDARSSIRVPVTAVLRKGETTQVWVIDPARHTVHARPVVLDETAAAAPGTVRVASGLDAGERIVIAGVHELTDGQDVRLGQEPRP